MSKFKSGQVWRQNDGYEATIRVLSDGNILDIYGEEEYEKFLEGKFDYDNVIEFLYDRDGNSSYCSSCNLVELIKDVSDIFNTDEEVKMKKLMNLVTETAKNGAKDGASLAVSKKFTELIKAKLGESYPAFLNTPLGSQLEAIIVPMLLIGICEVAPQVPHSDKIRKAGAHALRAAMSSSIQELVDDLMPMFDDLTEVLNDLD